MSNTRKPKGPVPIAKGRYAIFQTPEGDGVITYRPDGDEEDQHQVIPGGIFSMLLKAARGEKVDVNPMNLMKMLMGKLACPPWLITPSRTRSWDSTLLQPPAIRPGLILATLLPFLILRLSR